MLNVSSLVSDAYDPYGDYILNSKISRSQEILSPRGMSIALDEAGQKWVILKDKLVERFAGYLYLKNAIEQNPIERISVAENRVAILDKTVVLLSKYCEGVKPSLFSSFDAVQSITSFAKETKYSDLGGYANFCLNDRGIYVFDTELASFDVFVRANILQKFGPVSEEVFAAVSALTPTEG